MLSLKKYLFIVITLSTLFVYSQEQVEATSGIVTANALPGATLTVQDPLPASLDFTSEDPAVYVYFGFQDDSAFPFRHRRVFTADITLKITYSNFNNSITNVENKSLSITHDNKNDGIGNIIDKGVLKFPGAHRASVEVLSIVHKKPNGQVIANTTNLATYLELKFKTNRYHRFPINDKTVVFSDAKLITYDGQVATSTISNGVSTNQHEFEINWLANPAAVEYELEWVWVDNYGDNNTTLNTNEISLTAQDFQRNNTRVETKNTSYRIPLVYSKGYLIYRVRPITRFLDDIAINYYGDWTSRDDSSTKNTVSDWGNTILRIDQNHEQGAKNWQFQASYAEQGKKKEVISYFDGTLRNRQTVTKINSNNQAIAGENIYDNQGRPAIEILPVPLEESAIRYYDEINKNENNQPFTHKDFDWDDPTANEFNCEIDLAKMSIDIGASKYYSENNTPTNSYQDLVPNAKGFSFFTNRIYP